MHVGIAYALKVARIGGQAHALITLLYGLRISFTSNDPVRLAQWAAYIVGAEVLWRMTKCPIPWEFGKLSIVFVLGISIARGVLSKYPPLPFLYFVVLLPSALLTVLAVSLDEARQFLSFNLSGPACLAICSVWFPCVRGDASKIVAIGKGLVAPITGVAFIAVFSLATSDAEFGSNSNFAGSGGYGPNQVSSMLALGALFLSLMYFLERRHVMRATFGIFGLWLLIQSTLTFSRTGLYLFLGGIGAATLMLLRSKKFAMKLVTFIAILGLGGGFFFPLLNRFTNGALIERFSDKGLTGRDTIASMDYEIFRSNPILGVGPGISTIVRVGLGDEGHAAHTEYTRLLADHGILGLFALFLLIAMAVEAFIKSQGVMGQAIVSAFCVWSFGFMAGTGMRLAAPSFIMGLIHAGILQSLDLSGVVGLRKKPFFSGRSHRQGEAPQGR